MRLLVLFLSVIFFMATAAPVYKKLPKPLPLPRAESPATTIKTDDTSKDSTKEGFETAPKEILVTNILDPEKELPVQIRNISATIENSSEDTFSSVVVTCSFSDAANAGAPLSKQVILPTLAPKEHKSVTFSWNKSTDFGGYARFTGYDPSGAKGYDTPVNISGPKIEISSASRTPAQKPDDSKKIEPAKTDASTKKQDTPNTSQPGKKDESVKKDEPQKTDGTKKEESPKKEEPSK